MHGLEPGLTSAVIAIEERTTEKVRSGECESLAEVGRRIDATLLAAAIDGIGLLRMAVSDPITDADWARINRRGGWPESERARFRRLPRQDWRLRQIRDSRDLVATIYLHGDALVAVKLNLDDLPPDLMTLDELEPTWSFKWVGAPAS